MEESVTKKTVHEESSNVNSVCSSVDNCLQIGLRRRSLGLFKTNSSSALLQKISKECGEALDIMKRFFSFSFYINNLILIITLIQSFELMINSNLGWKNWRRLVDQVV